MLVNHANARADGVSRRAKLHALAVNNDVPFVWLVQAVQLAHEGAFARAILAQEGVYFAGLHVEAYFPVCPNAREALDDLSHLHVRSTA
jgi:hypothetical protein